MGKVGIKILNDVDYITVSIMISIAGKSSKYYAEHADALTSGRNERKGIGNCARSIKMIYESSLYITS